MLENFWQWRYRRSIESYSFGNIVIDGKEYTNDVKVFPSEVKDNWWRKEGHSLHPDDIEDVIERDPDVLIVGTGAYGRVSVPSDTKEHVESKGIELVAEKTREAIETFRDIKNEKTAVAALHLTC